EPSLAWAVPWISAAPIVPLKSLIVDISNGGNGGSTWTNGSAGTGVKSPESPPRIGVGSPGLPRPDAEATSTISARATTPTTTPTPRSQSPREEPVLIFLPFRSQRRYSRGPEI